MTPVEAAVSHTLIRLLDMPDLRPETLDLDGDLFERYGLTSLNLVLLMTSLCDETNTELSRITEEDLARLRTPRDVAALIEAADRKTPAATEA